MILISVMWAWFRMGGEAGARKWKDPCFVAWCSRWVLMEPYLEELRCRTAIERMNRCVKACVEDLHQPESDRVHSVSPRTSNTIASDCFVALALRFGDGMT